jgi:ATP-dependent helicase Lhr and Lhr-like helicase
MLSAKLHRFVEEQGWPDDPFVSHHGSLSKEVRHATEARLKRGLGVTAFATSSLELGIDIGEIRRVLQIDPPWTASSLRQRLGRSGRKDGQPSTLRLYVLE